MTSSIVIDTASKADLAAINQAALDYLEGYVQGDRDRHLSAYHSEAIKRRYSQDQDGIFGIIALGPETMADYAVTDTETDAECEVEVIIDAVSDDIASVRVYSCSWVDFLHVVKARGEWKLFHVTWHRRTD